MLRNSVQHCCKLYYVVTINYQQINHLTDEFIYIKLFHHTELQKIMASDENISDSENVTFLNFAPRYNNLLLIVLNTIISCLLLYYIHFNTKGTFQL